MPPISRWMMKMELWKRTIFINCRKSLVFRFRNLLRNRKSLLISFLFGCSFSVYIYTDLELKVADDGKNSGGNEVMAVLPKEKTEIKNGRYTLSKESEIQKRLEEAESVWLRGTAKRNSSLTLNPWTGMHFRSFWDYFAPNFDCPHVSQRVGKIGDGGKWICGLHHLNQKRKPCIVYSYGISTETSFEEEILQLTNCSVYMYDHTVDAASVTLVQQYPERARFYPLGIGMQNTASLGTLKTEMDRNQHDFIDILKMDVEGDEFASLAKVKSDFPRGLPFGQLQVELHLRAFSPISPAGLFKTFRNWWQMLENAGLRAFHNEVNFECPLKCVEYSFINTGVDNFLLHSIDHP